MQKTQSVAGIVFSPDRTQVLLIQRRDVPVWVLPGGGIDPGENAEDAVEREILEETGFTVKRERLVGVYEPINRLAKQTELYECEIVSGSAETTAETRQVRFFPLSRLPKMMPPPYPEWIEDGTRIGPPLFKQLSGVTYPVLLKNLFLHPLLVVRFLLARLGLSINSKN